MKKKNVSIYFPVCKGLSIDDVGVSRDTAFQEIRPGAGFETDDFDKEALGGLPLNDSHALLTALHGYTPLYGHTALLGDPYCIWYSPNCRFIPFGTTGGRNNDKILRLLHSPRAATQWAKLGDGVFHVGFQCKETRATMRFYRMKHFFLAKPIYEERGSLTPKSSGNVILFLSMCFLFFEKPRQWGLFIGLHF